MAAKRPSKSQIAARQKRLVRFQNTIGYSIGGLADEFGVTKKDVERFLSYDQKAIRRAYNRSPRLRQLYEQIGSPKESKVKGERLIPLAITPSQRQPIIRRVREGRISQQDVERIYFTSRQVEAYDTRVAEEELSQQNEWANWAEEHGVSASMAVNRELYNDGYIDDDLWAELIHALHEIYKKRGK